MDFLDGRKTYLIGLAAIVGGAVLIALGQPEAGITKIGEGLAVMFLRSAVAKNGVGR